MVIHNDSNGGSSSNNNSSSSTYTYSSCQVGQLESYMEFPFICMYIYFFILGIFWSFNGPSVVKETLDLRCILQKKKKKKKCTQHLRCCCKVFQLHSFSSELFPFFFSKSCSKIIFIRPNPMKKNWDGMKFFL